MIPFFDMPELFQSILRTLFYLLLMLTMVGVVYGIYLRLLREACMELVMFVICYLLCQSLMVEYPDRIPEILYQLNFLPVVFWILLFLGLLSIAVIVFLQIRYLEDFTITPVRIKTVGDELPCGICFYRANGRVVFANQCMNELCRSVTGKSLLNGRRFQAVIRDMMEINGASWNFQVMEHQYRGETLLEMVAWDVSEEYRMIQELQEGTLRLGALKKELDEYQISIDDVVKRQEILQAKAHIHDEMNRLMLSTNAADGQNAAQLDEIFTLWQRNALLLCMETEDRVVLSAMERLNQLAEILNMQLNLLSELPKEYTPRQRELLLAAAQEAIINAKKHGDADQVDMTFYETPDILTLSLTNNGTVPEGDITLVGGLSNLQRIAGEQGAEIQLSAEEGFTLTVVIRKNQGRTT
ncbi:MAG: hypothetical protein Q4B85_08430 [Lachnospiraceae bacterium]|nr:hypothetical protein [Lachnospiraceae bacterium]